LSPFRHSPVFRFEIPSLIFFPFHLRLGYLSARSIFSGGSLKTPPFCNGGTPFPNKNLTPSSSCAFWYVRVFSFPGVFPATGRIRAELCHDPFPPCFQMTRVSFFPNIVPDNRNFFRGGTPPPATPTPFFFLIPCGNLISLCGLPPLVLMVFLGALDLLF